MKILAKTSKVAVGDTAPDFTLPTHSEGELNLHWYQGRKHVMLAFYPGDWTPVCANQITGYKSVIDNLDALNCQLLAISCDSIPCHLAWAQSVGGLPFPLMSDFYPHGKVAELYGILNPRGYAERYIFIIDITGKIRYIENVGVSQVPDNNQLLAELAKLSR